MKQISDELFRARDSAESAWAYGNLATVREGMDDEYDAGVARRRRPFGIQKVPGSTSSTLALDAPSA